MQLIPTFPSNLLAFLAWSGQRRFYLIFSRHWYFSTFFSQFPDFFSISSNFLARNGTFLHLSPIFFHLSEFGAFARMLPWKKFGFDYKRPLYIWSVGFNRRFVRGNFLFLIIIRHNFPRISNMIVLLYKNLYTLIFTFDCEKPHFNPGIIWDFWAWLPVGGPSGLLTSSWGSGRVTHALIMGEHLTRTHGWVCARVRWVTNRQGASRSRINRNNCVLLSFWFCVECFFSSYLTEERPLDLSQAFPLVISKTEKR